MSQVYDGDATRAYIEDALGHPLNEDVLSVSVADFIAGLAAHIESSLGRSLEHLRTTTVPAERNVLTELDQIQYLQDNFDLFTGPDSELSRGTARLSIQRALCHCS